MKQSVFWSAVIWVFLWPCFAEAQLTVRVSPVECKGNKAVVKLAFKNDMTNAVESARATVRLMDEKNDVLGSSTKWVIGGQRNAPNLAPGATNTFFFVINSQKPLPTNLTARVIFNRIVTEGGKLGDPAKDVKILQ